MNELKTHADLNVLPLISYDLLIGMDWLEKHRVMLNYYDQTFTCLYDKGDTTLVKGIPRNVTILEISSLQMKRSVCKGFKFFAVYVMDNKENDNQIKIEDIPILNYFKEIFGRSSQTTSQEEYRIYDRFGTRGSTSIKSSISDEYSRAY